jgi:hypothetical protein
MEIVEGWKPKDYLNNLYSEFKASGTYKDLVDRIKKTRCVTIDYSNDFHVDIIPCIYDGDKYYVMNKNSDEFELTDGDGYATWFANKNRITGGNNLIKAVRLLKYWRDIKDRFAIKSILLTTLIGKQIDNNESQDNFADLPTTFKVLFNRLNDYLQIRESYSKYKDEITQNPVLADELFDRHWDENKYSNFRNNVSKFNTLVNESFEEQDRETSIKKWRKIFGDEFGKEFKFKKNSNPTVITHNNQVQPWAD